MADHYDEDLAALQTELRDLDPLLEQARLTHHQLGPLTRIELSDQIHKARCTLHEITNLTNSSDEETLESLLQPGQLRDEIPAITGFLALTLGGLILAPLVAMLELNLAQVVAPDFFSNIAATGVLFAVTLVSVSLVAQGALRAGRGKRIWPLVESITRAVQRRRQWNQTADH